MCPTPSGSILEPLDIQDDPKTRSPVVGSCLNEDGPLKAAFFRNILDSLTHQIAVISPDGNLEWVNQAWLTFSSCNEGCLDCTSHGVNYLEICRTASDSGDPDAEQVRLGIEAVIAGEKAEFYYEYPCHSPDEQRWFIMRAKPISGDQVERIVISHENITERKLAEQKVQALAVRDGLTGVSNRRAFDEALTNEWRRAQRQQREISLLLLDIDYFKSFNDTFGHVEGDEALKKIASTLDATARRPSDLVARYGGEEFGIILGDTSLETAQSIAEQLRAAVEALAIPHSKDATKPGTVSVSVGVATLIPSPEQESSQLITLADKALYRAKDAGRNRVNTAS